jgi:hypothetical protein
MYEKISRNRTEIEKRYKRDKNKIKKIERITKRGTKEIEERSKRAIPDGVAQGNGPAEWVDLLGIQV